jgi:hypothetical protein
LLSSLSGLARPSCHVRLALRVCHASRRCLRTSAVAGCRCLLLMRR